MSHIDPAVLTQLLIAFATLITAIAGWVKSQSNSKKIDENTKVTQTIAKATNGPITEIHATVKALVGAVAASASEARETASDAKAQAIVDAQEKTQ